MESELECESESEWESELESEWESELELESEWESELELGLELESEQMTIQTPGHLDTETACQDLAREIEDDATVCEQIPERFKARPAALEIGLLRQQVARLARLLARVAGGST